MGAVLSVEEKNRRIIAARELGERLGREISVEKIAPVLDVTDAKGVIFNTDLLETISDTGYSTAIGNRYYSVEPFLSNLIDTLLARNLIEFVGVIDRAAIHREKLAKARERYRAAIREKRAKHAELLTQKFGFPVETDDVLYVGEAFAEIAEKSDLSKKNTFAKKYLSPEVFAANFVHLGASRFATARRLLPILKADIIKNRAEILEKKRRAKEEEIRFSRATQAAHAAEVEKKREERARGEQARREKQIQQLKEKRAAKVAKRAEKEKEKAIARAARAAERAARPRKVKKIVNLAIQAERQKNQALRALIMKSAEGCETRRKNSKFIAEFSRKYWDEYDNQKTEFELHTPRKFRENATEYLAHYFPNLRLDKGLDGRTFSEYKMDLTHALLLQQREFARWQFTKMTGRRVKNSEIATAREAAFFANKGSNAYIQHVKRYIRHLRGCRVVFYLKSDIGEFMENRAKTYFEIARRGLSDLLGREIAADDIYTIKDIRKRFCIYPFYAVQAGIYFKCCFLGRKIRGVYNTTLIYYFSLSELQKHITLTPRKEAKKNDCK